MREARYVIEIETQEETRIRDIGPWDRHPTVTNDAENVVRRLHEDGLLPAGRILTYVDTDGRTDQLLHDGHGKFMGFVPGGVSK